ncbi:NADH-quinone oxidoreductase subunit C [Candidatus Sumerlaeota bacterium]|nr:NADH-quinone oxidoreductase subunit C [Candidatus Sumerlaeota bacterium]
MALATTDLLTCCREAIRRVNESALMDETVFRDEVTFHVDKRWIVPVIRTLKSDPKLQFDMLSDITAIDYLNLEREPRFDVVYHLYSLENHHRVRLKAPVGEEDCEIESLCGLWSGANFMEREVYDMFGISFANHPDLRRILMPDNWEGHPLRKDFPIGGSKSFYYKHDTDEYAGEPDDLVPRIRVQEGDI